MSLFESRLKKRTGSSLLAFILIIVLNVALICSALLLILLYSSEYRENLWEENLEKTAKGNKASYTLATTLFSSWNQRINDLAQYIEINDLSYAEALRMISDENSSKTRFFEIINSEYKGHMAKSDGKGGYITVDYSHDSYAPQQKSFDDVNDGDLKTMCFLPEFTGAHLGDQSFAMYRHVTLKNADGQPEVYTLLLAARSVDITSVINGLNTDNSMASVLIDGSGNYIVRNSRFISSNFFQYLYKRNELTLDQKNSLIDEMTAKGSGEFFYKNAELEDCVFRYEKVPDSDWYCVTCVPISTFSESSVNSVYIIISVFLLIALLAIDVSWMKGTNGRLRKSMIREQEANSAKSNFMSRMSHEIRTPLNAVIGYNTIARNEMSNAKDEVQIRRAEMKVMDCLTKSDVASKHLLTVINDVLDMSAIESQKIKVSHERFDFKGLINSLTTIFYSQSKLKNIDFEVVFDTVTEEWFIGDRLRINQILTNLLSNAVKFTGEYGSIRLTISMENIDSKTTALCFEVSDTGIGMAPEYLEHLWDPFEQADASISRRFGGTGLGMTITKSLVDLMNGTIEVESELGVGSTFRVHLNLERLAQRRKTKVYNFDDVRVLVVDDDKSTCDYISLLLSRCEVKSVCVTNGEDAVRVFERAESTDDRFTMCLIDWRMPEMDGIEVIRRISEISDRYIPKIVITAYDLSDLDGRAAEYGITEFISKPVFQSSLFDLLVSLYCNEADTVIKTEKKHDFTGTHILLAEDNDMNMEIAKNILESVGVTVDGVGNGKLAVERFTESAPGTFDAILMDVQMPVLDGYSATIAIRNSSHPEAKTIPIIAMTADAFSENIAQSLKAGMNDHLSKPIEVETMFYTLKKYIGQK